MAKKTPAAAAPELAAMIAERAYFRSEQRGFAPGHEIEDWLAAEAELNATAKPETEAKPKAEKTANVKKAKAA